MPSCHDSRRAHLDAESHNLFTRHHSRLLETDIILESFEGTFVKGAQKNKLLVNSSSFYQGEFDGD